MSHGIWYGVCRPIYARAFFGSLLAQFVLDRTSEGFLSSLPVPGTTGSCQAKWRCTALGHQGWWWRRRRCRGAQAVQLRTLHNQLHQWFWHVRAPVCPRSRFERLKSTVCMGCWWAWCNSFAVLGQRLGVCERLREHFVLCNYVAKTMFFAQVSISHPPSMSLLADECGAEDKRISRARPSGGSCVVSFEDPSAKHYHPRQPVWCSATWIVTTFKIFLHLASYSHKETYTHANIHAYMKHVKHVFVFSFPRRFIIQIHTHT